MSCPKYQETPLTDTGAEKRVLCAMLMNNRCIKSALRHLRFEFFVDQGCREVFKLISRLYQNNEPVNIERITSELKDSSEIDDIHILLTDVGETTTTSANIAYDINLMIEVAARRLLSDIGGKLTNGARDGYDPAEMAQIALKDIEQIKSDCSGCKCRRQRFGELRDQNPSLSQPVIDGLFRKGETVNLIADTKIGKSWMVYGLALSIVSGRDWLGFPVAQGSVLIVDNELQTSLLANRIDLVAQAMHVSDEEASRLLEVISLRGDLQSLTGLATDFEDIELGEFKAIIMDAKYRFAEPGSDENSNTSETQFYNQIDRIAKQTGAAIILVHHASKGNQAGKKVTDVGAGAGAQSRAADCHLILREHEKSAAFVLDATVRSFPPVRAIGLRYDFPLWRIDDSVDVNQLEGLKGKQQIQKEKNDQKSKALIVEKMNCMDDQWVTNKMLQPLTGLSYHVLKRLLPMLVFDKIIVSRPVRKGGRDTDEYQLSSLNS